MRTLAMAALVFLLCVSTSRADDVRLSMSASQNRVQAGEPFAIEIRAELSGVDDDDTEIDLPEFDDFEVLGRRVSRPFSFSFGFGTGGQNARVQSELIYHFTLRAHTPGRHVIQPAVITVAGRKYATRPLTIEVGAGSQPLDPNALPGAGLPGQQVPSPGSNAQGAPPTGPLDGARFDPEMFVRTVVDRHRAYVGEQVTVTIYLYVRGSLRDTPSVTREPTNEGFWIQDLLPPQRSLSAVRQEVNGRAFAAYVLRRYAAFPMRPGKLQIGAPAVETSAGGSLFDLFTGPSRPVRRDGVPVTIEVSPLPEHADAARPVHVGQLALEASLDPPNGKVGDAITLRVAAKGVGNLRALKLEAPQIQGIDVLPPEIDDRVSTDLDQVGGERVFRWLLLPKEAGAHTIPAITVDVLDPKTGTYAPVRTDQLKLPITGSAIATATANSQNIKADTPPTKETPGDVEGRPTYGPARSASALKRTKAPLFTAPWYSWAVLAGPALLLLGLGANWSARQMRAQKQRRGAGHGLKISSDHLARARAAIAQSDAQSALSALSQALKSALEIRLAEPIGGLSRSALPGFLKDRGMADGLANSLVRTLEELDHQRFAPTPKSASELAPLAEETARSLKELERFSPRARA